jgi:hypothetical protein
MPKSLSRPLPLVFVGQARPLQVVYSGWSSFEVRANLTKPAQVGFEGKGTRRKPQPDTPQLSPSSPSPPSQSSLRHFHVSAFSL